MAHSCNRLWEPLIDRKMRRTEMRQHVGIGANILAKMGKDEPISLGSPAKIYIALGRAIEEIMEISADRATEDR